MRGWKTCGKRSSTHSSACILFSRHSALDVFANGDNLHQCFHEAMFPQTASSTVITFRGAANSYKPSSASTSARTRDVALAQRHLTHSRNAAHTFAKGHGVKCTGSSIVTLLIMSGR